MSMNEVTGNPTDFSSEGVCVDNVVSVPAIRIIRVTSAGSNTSNHGAPGIMTPIKPEHKGDTKQDTINHVIDSHAQTDSGKKENSAENSKPIGPADIVITYALYPDNGHSEIQDEVIYVNPKQYKRILARRLQRQKLIDGGHILPPGSKRLTYLHESRHRHALKRNRSDGGRFSRGAVNETLLFENIRP